MRIENRIAALEAIRHQEQMTSYKVLHSHLIHSYTDEELLDFLGLPHGATDEQLQAIWNGEGANHGKS